MKKIIYLLTIVITYLLCVPAIVNAQDYAWQEAGNLIVNQNVAGLMDYHGKSICTDQNGTLYGLLNLDGGFYSKVMSSTGGTWSDLSNGISFSPCDLKSSGGVIFAGFAGYSENGNGYKYPHVSRYTGTGWQSIGGIFSLYDAMTLNGTYNTNYVIMQKIAVHGDYTAVLLTDEIGGTTPSFKNFIAIYYNNAWHFTPYIEQGTSSNSMYIPNNLQYPKLNIAVSTGGTIYITGDVHENGSANYCIGYCTLGNNSWQKLSNVFPTPFKQIALDIINNIYLIRGDGDLVKYSFNNSYIGGFASNCAAMYVPDDGGTVYTYAINHNPDPQDKNKYSIYSLNEITSTSTPIITNKPNYEGFYADIDNNDAELTVNNGNYYVSSKFTLNGDVDNGLAYYKVAKRVSYGCTPHPYIKITNPYTTPSYGDAILVSCGTTSTCTLANNDNLGTNPTYQWKLNGNNIVGATNATLVKVFDLSDDSKYLTCQVTSTGCGGVSASSIYSIQIHLQHYTVTNTIGYDIYGFYGGYTPTSFCTNETVHYLAQLSQSYPQSNHPNDHLLWYVNGTLKQDKNLGQIFIDGTFYSNQADVFQYPATYNDQIVCILQANPQGCAFPDVQSNTMTPPVAHISIIPGNNPICLGASLTYYATATNAGSNQQYQWQVNGANFGSTTTSSSLSYTPNVGDLVSCLLLTNSGCTETSNNASVTVNVFVPSVNISLGGGVSGDYCVANGSALFVANNNLNNAISSQYFWKVNGVINPNYSGTQFIYTPNDGDIVSCTMHTYGGSICGQTTTDANSNSITMHAITPINESVTISSSFNPCTGEVTFTPTPVNGGTTNYYYWYVNGVGVANGTSNFTYTPLIGDQIYCDISSTYGTGICGPTTPPRSNTISITAANTLLTKYVDASVIVSGNGNSWATAYKTLAEAMNLINQPCNGGVGRINVAQGTYYPTGSQSSTDRDSAFTITNGNVKIYGGYPTGGGLRNPKANLTILDGDIGISGTNTDNSYHVLVVAGLASTADSVVVDGFTIQHGYARDASIGGVGFNFKTYNGVSIDKKNGGAVVVANAANLSKVSFRNLIIANNTALFTGGKGAGIYCSNALLWIINSVFTQNSTGAQGQGAGMAIEGTGGATIQNSIFHSNNAFMGGGLYNALTANSSIIVSQCLFYGNTATSDGAGIYNNGTGSVAMPTIGGSVFWNNLKAGTTVSSITNNANLTSSPYVSFCDAPETLSSYYSNAGNLSIDPQFADVANPKGADGIWGTIDDGFRQTCGSPIIDNGGGASAGGIIAADIIGANRVVDVKIDMGPYEVPAGTSLAANGNTASVNMSTIHVAYSFVTNCRKICQITAVGGGMGGGHPFTGTMNTKVTIDPTVQSTGNDKYVQRHYDIEPQFAANGQETAEIHLFYLNSEFQAYNTAVGAGHLQLPDYTISPSANIGNLHITQYHGTSSTGLPGSYSGTTEDVTPASVTWNTAYNCWEVTIYNTGFSGFFAKAGAGILPLRLLSFNGTAKDKYNELQWKTADETNTKTFSIERSNDGSSFSGIGNVATQGAGNNSYSFSDLQPLSGNNFYRLKMVDNDGRFTYSNIIKLSNTGSTNQLSTIAPNPTSGLVTLTIGDKNLINSNALLIDISGKQLQSIKITGNTQTIDVSKYPSGVYLIRLSSGEVMKIIKQ